MTNWEYIKTLDEKEIAKRLSLSVIPDDECSTMFVYGAGYFEWTEDIENWLKSEYSDREE